MQSWKTQQADPPVEAGKGKGKGAGKGAIGNQQPQAPVRKELYYQWALDTQWRGFDRSVSGKPGAPIWNELRIIATATDAATLANLKSASLPISIHPLYTAHPPGASRDPSFFTATVTREGLAWIHHNCPGLRWELALPLRRPEDVTDASRAGEYGGTRSEADLTAREVLKPPAKPNAAKDGCLDRAIAVIDYGCPFLHAQLLDARPENDAASTRLHVLWDQETPQRWWTRTHPTFQHDPWWTVASAAVQGSADYGRFLSGTDIDEMRRQLTTRIDETEVYRSVDHLINRLDPRRRVWHATHGAHVLDVIGGRHDPLDPQAAPDKAGCAPLIFVQLPGLTAADGSGGSLAAHVLDGVRFAMAQCKVGAPLVVNVSYGTYAGPHDGSSMLEQALDDLLDARPDSFAIVLAAGNARQADCHARRTVSQNRSALLRLYLPPEDTTDTFVEIWYGSEYEGKLRMRVRTPQRAWSDWVPAGGPRVRLEDLSAGNQVVATLQHESVVMHGSKPMALLAVAPTARASGDTGALAESGLWEIEVALIDEQCIASVPFDAWVERDDPGYRGIPGATEQPRFLGLRRGDELNTLSSMATGQRTVVVGGFRGDDGERPGYVSLPAPDAPQRALPLMFALCEEDAQLPSIRAAAVRSLDTHRMNGTSVAAPVLARQLFNALCDGRQPPGRPSDWAELLEELSQSSPQRVRRSQ